MPPADAAAPAAPRSFLHLIAGVLLLLTLALASAWWLGGQAMLRRIDPALLVPFLPLAVFPVAMLWRLLLRQRRWAGYAAGLTVLVAVQMWLMLRYGTNGEWRQGAVVLAGGAAAFAIADMLVQWRRGRAFRIILAMVVAIGWFAAGHMALATAYASATHGVATPSVRVLTSLPLGMGQGSELGAALRDGAAVAPVITELRRHMPVDLADSVVAQPVRGDEVLLLAHPRALAPAELVAIDAHVRRGGRALILADALSSWPVDHPLGDARNPPITSLLTPLLTHWGTTLDAPDPARQEGATLWISGRPVALFTPGHFAVTGPGCTAVADGLGVRCHIGRGHADIIGDADLLYAPLWQASPAWAAHLRTADTIAFLADRLAPGSSATWLRPAWIDRDHR